MALPCKSEQGIRLVRESALGHDVTAFLVDRAARGLAQGTLEYYRRSLRTCKPTSKAGASAMSRT